MRYKLLHRPINLNKKIEMGYVCIAILQNRLINEKKWMFVIGTPIDEENWEYYPIDKRNWQNQSILEQIRLVLTPRDWIEIFKIIEKFDKIFKERQVRDK
jgi:hypothetical protein